MKIVLCTFANKLMHKSALRLKSQAEQFHLFDEIYLYDEAKLPKSFKRKYKDVLKPTVRGFGYWCWKPQIIQQTLELMDDGDILLYLDAGSHLNINGKERLLEYIEMVKTSNPHILGFQDVLLEKWYTKREVLDYFDLDENSEISNSGQLETGHIFIQKSEFSLKFIKKWKNIIDSNYRLVTDETSSLAEYPDFREHRHDQSIYSILAKKYDIIKISNKETYSIDWSTLDKYPILAKRDKQTSYSLAQRIKRKLTQIISKR